MQPAAASGAEDRGARRSRRSSSSLPKTGDRNARNRRGSITSSCTTSRCHAPNVGGTSMSASGGLPVAARDRRRSARSTSAARFARVEVAGDREHGVVRRVVRREELRDVVEARGVQVLHRADQRVVERMLRRKARAPEAAPTTCRTAGCPPTSAARSSRRRAACRASPASSPGSSRPMRSASSQSASSSWLRRNRLEVVRAVEPGGAVQRAAGALDRARSARWRRRAPSPGRACARTGARSRCGPSRSFAEPTWYQRFTATIGAVWSSDSVTTVRFPVATSGSGAWVPERSSWSRGRCANGDVTIQSSQPDSGNRGYPKRRGWASSSAPVAGTH